MKYNFYIGRFQPPHKGHMFLFAQSLEKNEPVCIAIRDVPPDEKNPLTAEQVKVLWETVYRDNENVKVIIIPDISAVKYGRDVGYRVEELIPPTNIAGISATGIRKSITEGNDDWKTNVDSSIWETVKSLLINS